MTAPRTTLALALGFKADSQHGECACCGPSSFSAAGPTASVLGRNFTDQDLLADPRAESICEGCAACLGGRPGRVPPPLRTISVRVDVDRPELVTLDMAAWWALLTGEDAIPETGAVLSWATSRKRHHWLRAGTSTPDLWAVGADAGTIHWRPDPELPDAVLSLRQVGASKGAILAGIYPPQLHAAHRDRVAAAEQRLAPVRGCLILDLVVWAAPAVDRADQEQPEEATVIDPVDAQAAALIAELVWGSEMRATEGKQFWGGYLLRRMRRFARLPLPTFLSRMTGECRVSVASAAAAANIVGRLDDDETASVEAALRERTDLIHALAFDRVQGIRAERKRETTT